MKPSNIEIFNSETIARQLIDFTRFFSKNGCFRLVLAGGNTPKQVYEFLEQKQLNSNKWEIFLRMIEKAHYYLTLKAKNYLIKNI